MALPRKTHFVLISPVCVQSIKFYLPKRSLSTENTKKARRVKNMNTLLKKYKNLNVFSSLWYAT